MFDVMKAWLFDSEIIEKKIDYAVLKVAVKNLLATVIQNMKKEGSFIEYMQKVE